MRLMPWLLRLSQLSSGLMFPRRRLATKRPRRSTSVGLERLEGRVLLAADGDFGFAFTAQDTLTSLGTAIATDASDNLLVAGFFLDTIDLDPGPGVTQLISTAAVGLPNSFIAKYAPDGSLIWARVLAGDASQIRGLTTDGDGNVYATGLYQGTVDFDPGAGTQSRTSAGLLDIFVWKLNSDGDFGFVAAMGGTGNDLGTGIAVDGNHNVYTTGGFQGTVDFDPGAGVQNRTSQGGYDIYVSKLDSSGNFLFAKTVGSEGDDNSAGIALDRLGDVFTTGNFTGTVDFDPGASVRNRTSLGGSDAFIFHLDHNGNFGFALTLGGSGADGGFAIDVDSNDNIYYTGVFSGTVDFNLGAGIANRSTQPGDTDAFVSKLDSDGNLLYATTFGGLNGEVSGYLAVDRNGNAYAAGTYMGTMDFDPGPGIDERTSNGGRDDFVLKLDANGDYAYAASLGGPGDDAPTGIAVDNNGNVYSTGTFLGTADFDPGPATYNLTGVESAIYNLFVSKLLGPAVNLSVSSAFANETSQTQITVTVTADAPVVGDQTVDLAVTGTGITLGDYSLTDADSGLPGIQVKILNGQTTGTATFTVSSDNLVELSEIATLTISNPSAGLHLDASLEKQVTIVDDDSAVISISNATVTEGGLLSFDVSISNPVDVAITANIATADGTATTGNNDYSALNSTSVQLFAAGSTSTFTISVNTTADGTVEPDEALSLILSSLSSGVRSVMFNGDGALLTATGTITNNDIDLSITRDQAAGGEGQSGSTSFTFTVTRTGATTGTTTAAYAVTGVVTGADFVGGTLPSGTVTFAPGGLQQTITISVQGDITVEPDESFTVTLSIAADSIGTNAVEIVTASDLSTISNDDTAPTLAITPDGTLTSAASTTFTFQFSRAMTDFTALDVTLTNGVAGTFTEVTPQTYTLVVTPIADGVVTVTVDAGKAVDAGGNPNPSATASITSDRTGPVFSTPANINVAENTAAVETAAATDAHGPVTFGLVAGGDASLFNIDPTTGVLTFLASPDFEDPADADVDNVYSLQVRATDALGVSTTQTLDVTVTAVNENAPQFTSGAAFQVAENITLVGAIAATDSDLPSQSVTLTITGGADAGSFFISNAGDLIFNSTPDFEAPADANQNNVYEVQVTAADGLGLTTTQSLTVTVTNIGEAPQLSNVSAVTWTKLHPKTPIKVLPAIIVTAPNSLAGGTLLITMNTVGSKRKAADLLQSPSMSAIGSGSGFVYADGKLTLQIELGEQATAAKIQTLLQGITFITKGKGLKTTTRTLQVTLTDATDLSGTVSQTIHVRKKA